MNLRETLQFYNNNGNPFFQVHQTKVSFFINGLEEDNTAFDTRTLSGSMVDFASGTVQIGQSLFGKILTSDNLLVSNYLVPL